MLTLRRFRAMTESYGADLRRWPPELLHEAEALLKVSDEARALVGAAQSIDEAIEALMALEDAAHQRSVEADAALARLRSSVAARIVASAAQNQGALRFRSRIVNCTRQPRADRFLSLGMAAATGCAILAGLLIGSTYGPEPASNSALAAVLQSAPIHILSD